MRGDHRAPIGSSKPASDRARSRGKSASDDQICRCPAHGGCCPCRLYRSSVHARAPRRPAAPTPASVPSTRRTRGGSMRIEPLIARGHRREEAARRGRPRRRGDRVALSEGLRQPRARAGRRADDARHHLRPGLAHEGRRDDDERDDAGRGGRIRLSDRVATYIPGFERYGKGDITVRHLLTHVSGLRPDVDLGDDVDRLRHGDRAGGRGSPDRSARASGSSTATSTSSCSATSCGA